MEQASWQVPVFCCDELQTPHAMPMFLSRKALQEAWVVSGRKLSDLPQQATKLPWLYFFTYCGLTYYDGYACCGHTDYTLPQQPVLDLRVLLTLTLTLTRTRR